MNKSPNTIARIITVAAVVALIQLLPSAAYAQQQVDVSGFTFPIATSPTVGRFAGPNFVADRTLVSLIFPCTVAFCGVDTNGFSGTTMIAESATRIDRNGDRFYRALAKQTITGSIVVNGFTYTDCTINQTVVASGGLMPGPIDTATASNIQGTWTITGGSSCSGGTVKLSGHGTLVWTGTGVPTYQGTIQISQ